MQLNRPSLLSRSCLSVALAASVLCSAQAQSAGEPQTLISNGDVRITTLDIQADALRRIPEDKRGEVLSNPQNVEQIARGLYLFRMLAQEFEKQPQASQPEIQAALRQVRERFLADTLRTHIIETSRPSEEAAEAYARTLYKANPERFARGEQVRASHILIAGEGDEPRVQAEEILAQLKAGADFAELAREKSADPGSAAKGGDLGFFGRGQMVPEFDAAAFSLKPGALSDVVKTQFGYHIVLLQERRPAGTKPFEEVRDELVAEVRNKASTDALRLQHDKIHATAQMDHEAIEAYSKTWVQEDAKP